MNRTARHGKPCRARRCKSARDAPLWPEAGDGSGPPSRASRDPVRVAGGSLQALQKGDQDLSPHLITARTDGRADCDMEIFRASSKGFQKGLHNLGADLLNAPPPPGMGGPDRPPARVEKKEGNTIGSGNREKNSNLIAD